MLDNKKSNKERLTPRLSDSILHPGSQSVLCEPKFPPKFSRIGLLWIKNPFRPKTSQNPSLFCTQEQPLSSRQKYKTITTKMENNNRNLEDIFHSWQNENEETWIPCNSRIQLNDTITCNPAAALTSCSSSCSLDQLASFPYFPATSDEFGLAQDGSSDPFGLCFVSPFTAKKEQSDSQTNKDR